MELNERDLNKDVWQPQDIKIQVNDTFVSYDEAKKYLEEHQEPPKITEELNVGDVVKIKNVSYLMMIVRTSKNDPDNILLGYNYSGSVIGGNGNEILFNQDDITDLITKREEYQEKSQNKKV